MSRRPPRCRHPARTNERRTTDTHSKQTAHKVPLFHSLIIKRESPHCGRGRNRENGREGGGRHSLASREEGTGERGGGGSKQQATVKQATRSASSDGGRPASGAHRLQPLEGALWRLLRPGATVEGRRVEHPRQCRSLHYGMVLPRV